VEPNEGLELMLGISPLFGSLFLSEFLPVVWELTIVANVALAPTPCAGFILT